MAYFSATTALEKAILRFWPTVSAQSPFFLNFQGNAKNDEIVGGHCAAPSLALAAAAKASTSRTNSDRLTTRSPPRRPCRPTYEFLYAMLKLEVIHNEFTHAELSLGSGRGGRIDLCAFRLSSDFRHTHVQPRKSVQIPSPVREC